MNPALLALLGARVAAAAAGGGPLSSTFLQVAGSVADASTYTWSAQNLGDAASDRHIVVCLIARAAASISVTGVTVAGQAATIDAQSVGENLAAIAHVAVPSGATGDVVVSLSGAAVRSAVALYRVTGAHALAASSTGVGASSASVTGVPDGVSIASALTTATTASWPEPFTLDADSSTGESLQRIAVGRSTTTGAITATPTSAVAVAAAAYTAA